MNKGMIVSTVAFSILSVSAFVTTSSSILATSYDGDLNALSPVTVLVEDDESTIIPPVDPENPTDPIDPILPNPNPTSLAITYISGLDFGQVVGDGKKQIIGAKSDVDMNGTSFDNLVSLRDIRSLSQRDGWTLTVKQNSELLEGATISMNPFISPYTAERFDLSTNGEITLNEDAQVFAKTNSSANPSGSVSIGMAQPGEAVTLSIPDTEYEAGEYSTSLNWELVSGPIGN